MDITRASLNNPAVIAATLALVMLVGSLAAVTVGGVGISLIFTALLTPAALRWQGQRRAAPSVVNAKVTPDSPLQAVA
ncbi:MAG: hypothetical protein SGI99_17580 [Pseudomonadota bacterium]|nr:hypothetical protein [Pseudomonadota bacterium]